MANVDKFKYWCNKILPLVYDDSLSYYEFLGKVYEKLNETIDAVNANTEAIDVFDKRIDDFITDERQARLDWEAAEALSRHGWETEQERKLAAFEAMFVSEYDSTATYTAGDICSEGGKMYAANASTTGTFDPTKWNEIVLADYLSNYVETAATSLQNQYDAFLETYQRDFGVTNAFGSSTTDAISQKFYTDHYIGYKNSSYVTVNGTNAKDASAIPGTYTISPAEAATMTNLPADYNTSAYGSITVIFGSLLRICAQQTKVWTAYSTAAWAPLDNKDFLAAFGTSTTQGISQKFYTDKYIGYKNTNYVTVNGTDAKSATAQIGTFMITPANAATMSNLPAGYDDTKYGSIFVLSPTLLRLCCQKTAVWYLHESGEWLLLNESIKWRTKKWAAVGDSLTEFNVRATTNYIGYIAADTGIQYTNVGVSGTGYKRGEGNNNAFYQRVQNISTDNDVITIFGSGNDLGVSGFPLGNADDTGTTTICGCINQTLDNILNLYMAAEKAPQIGIIAPTPWINYTPDISNNNMSKYVAKLKEICERRSIPFLDLYHHSNLHPDNATFRSIAYSRDEGNGVHPDENGHKLIAPMIEEFISSLII